MNNLNNDKEKGVQKTGDVIDINAVDPDDKREEALKTTNFAEALSKDVDDHTPTLAAFPDEEDKEKDGEPGKD